MAGDAPSGRRLAVVLFNLGGPDRLKAVRPFLFNLFSDPAIIGAPAVIRYPLAALISWARERSAQRNYARMGGASPLLRETEAQAQALRKAIGLLSPGVVVRTFIAMRYWSPLIARTAQEVAAFEPDEVVLAPLYPHFSTTTTGSSLAEWKRLYRGPGRIRSLCCYPLLDGLVRAQAEQIRAAWIDAGRPGDMRLLFSAHGLPQRVIDRGDPYQSQIEATAAAVAARVADILPDWRICYQSRVGPMKWLGPTTPQAILAAAEESLGVVVSPIAFVSEHIETLVELDHDYALLAADAGARPYVRAPAPGVRPAFIDDLARMIAASGARRPGIAPGSAFQCEDHWTQCPLAREPEAA